MRAGRENIAQSHMHPTQSGKRMSQGLDGVRKAAKERKQERFTALLHHLNVDLLRDSFFALQRKASPGVDGVTWQEYETGLEDRLVDLHSRVHRGAYRAKPSRRVFIPKADGRRRPLGIAWPCATVTLNDCSRKGFGYVCPRSSQSDPRARADLLSTPVSQRPVLMGEREWHGPVMALESRREQCRNSRFPLRWNRPPSSRSSRWFRIEHLSLYTT